MKKIGIILFLALLAGVGFVCYLNSNYEKNEVEQLVHFFNQPSAIAGKTNGEVLGYHPQYPFFLSGVIAHKYDGKYKAKSISFFDKGCTGNKIVKGTLILQDFAELTSISVADNAIDSLILKRCPNLKTIISYDNKITYVLIEECKELRQLTLTNNLIDSLDVSDLPNLHELDVNNCPLKHLKVNQNQPWQKWNTAGANIIVVDE